MNGVMTVLVVDDDADLRDVVMFAVQREGRQVIGAEDGREALDYILSHGLPDLILLDMNMPIMNGWEFARELRARSLWGAPVVVMTAAHDAEQSSSEIGAAGILGKPFEIRTLNAMVERFSPPAALKVEGRDDRRIEATEARP